MALADWRSRLAAFVFEPPLRGIVERLPILKRKARGHRRTHPFDIELGVETSGYLPVSAIQPDQGLMEKMDPYQPCQPSIVREIVSRLPENDEFTFVDLGCGKGRALIVASEFRFRRIVGVELSERLANVARANSAVIERKYPHRGRLDIRIEDGGRFCLEQPYRKAAIYFYYNAFPDVVLAEFLSNLERHHSSEDEKFFFVYINPSAYDTVDRCELLTRYSADSISYAPSELGYGPDQDETVVIWQSRPARYPMRPGADRRPFKGSNPHHIELA